MPKGRIIGHGDRTRYLIDGEEVSKKAFDAVFPDKPICGRALPNTLMETSKSWPRMSDALGVHSSQVAKAEAQAARLGVPTEFVKEGKHAGAAIIRDNAHQRDLMKALGHHNTDGGYGQVTG